MVSARACRLMLKRWYQSNLDDAKSRSQIVIHESVTRDVNVVMSL